MVMQRQRVFGISDPFHDRSESHRDRLPSLSSFINGERNPKFIIPINTLTPIPFEILLSNDAFNLEIAPQVEGLGNVAVLFRAWAQVVAHWRDLYEFGGRTWTAYTIDDRWKCVRATDQSSQEARSATEYRKDRWKSNEDAVRRLEKVKLAEARLASVHRMSKYHGGLKTQSQSHQTSSPDSVAPNGQSVQSSLVAKAQETVYL
jgi:hypothetical protein